jgi:hypothetical protein
VFYKSRGSTSKKKGGNAIKVALVLLVVFVYFASYQYIKKNDNRIVLDSIKIDNGNTK